MARATREIWTKRVRRWRRSGLKATAFAEREGLKTKTLWWWGWRLAREKRVEPRPGFVEVVAAENSAVPEPVIEVVAAGARVAVPVDFDENTLRRVLRVVEGR